MPVKSADLGAFDLTVIGETWWFGTSMMGLAPSPRAFARESQRAVCSDWSCLWRRQWSLIVVDEMERSLTEIRSCTSSVLISSKGFTENTIVTTRYAYKALDAKGIKKKSQLSEHQAGGRRNASQIQSWWWTIGHEVIMDYNTTGDGQLTGVQLTKIMQETGKKLSELLLK